MVQAGTTFIPAVTSMLISLYLMIAGITNVQASANASSAPDHVAHLPSNPAKPQVPSHLIIDLDSPLFQTEGLLSHSYRNLSHWADLLMDDKWWTTAHLTKLRGDLVLTNMTAPHNTVKSASSSPSAAAASTSASTTASSLLLEYTPLLDFLIMDLREGSAHASAPVLFQFDTQADPLTTPPINNYESSKIRALASSLIPGNLTIAFEVGVCGNSKVRKVHVALHDCVDGPFGEPDHFPDHESVFTTWSKTGHSGEGFRGCDKVCRDGAARITDAWSMSESSQVPTKLVLYTPTPLSDCSTLHFMTTSFVFGVPTASGPTSSSPFAAWSPVMPIALDKQPVWHDDRVSIIVGDAMPSEGVCTPHLETAIGKLPISDRLALRSLEAGGECETHLDGMDWDAFMESYESVILKNETLEETWPSFAGIFLTNVMNTTTGQSLKDEIDAAGLWNASIFSHLPCSNWSSLISNDTSVPNAVSVRNPTFIPVMNAEGPQVDDLYQLIDMSLTLALTDPSNIGTFEETYERAGRIVKSVFGLCHACRGVPTVSYDAVYQAARAVVKPAEPASCKNGTLLGGRGDGLAFQLTRVAEKYPGGPRTVGGLVVTPTKAKPQKLDKAELVVPVLVSEAGKEDTVSNLLLPLYEKCPAFGIIQLSASTDDLMLSVPSQSSTIKKGQAEVKYTSMPLSSVGGRKTLTVTSGMIVSRSDATSQIFANASDVTLAAFAARVTRDGRKINFNVTLPREMYGWFEVVLEVSLGNATVTEPVSASFVCGYAPITAESQILHEHSASSLLHSTALPHTNALTDWFAASVQDLSTYEITIPLRYHLLTLDLEGLSEYTPYLASRLGFLAPQSAMIALQSARGLSHPLGIPTNLRSRFALTDSCAFKGSAALVTKAPSSRLLYRSDLFEVPACVEEAVFDATESGEDQARQDVLKAALGLDIELPSIFIATSKKTKQKIAVISVNWQPASKGTHKAEMDLLLFAMESVRVNMSLSVVVAGQFNDDLATVASDALFESGMWKNFFIPSSSGLVDSYMWAPTVPTSNRRFAPAAKVYSSLEECLVVSPKDVNLTASCAEVAEYSKWYRKSVGGLIAEDRLESRHEACAVDVSGDHLPVSYTVEIGEDQVRLVTFNIGKLTEARLNLLRETTPALFDYLTSFDVIALQSEASESNEQVGVTMAEILSTWNATSPKSFVHSSSKLPSHPGNLHIFHHPDASKLEALSCAVQSYSSNAGSLLGCSFSTNGKPWMVVTLDDASASGSLLTSPGADLPETESFVMKRLYTQLCTDLASYTSETGKGPGWCGSFPVTAMFVGTWGDSVYESGAKGRINGTYADFKHVIGAVEEEIARKNSFADDSGDKNTKVKVQAVVPPERVASIDGKGLLFEETSVVGNMFGWLIGSKNENSQALWPYWTDKRGSVSDYMVLWSPIVESTVTTSSTASASSAPSSAIASSASVQVPSDTVRIDAFLHSSVCQSPEETKSRACRGTLPSCVNREEINVVAARFEVLGERKKASVCLPHHDDRRH